MSETLERFMAEVDKAIDDALRRGAQPDDLEMVLQTRSQDMREQASEE